MTITILGLGLGDSRTMTMGAHDALQNAREVFLRAHEHSAFAGLPSHLKVHPFFEASDSAIADDIIARADHGDVLYVVPGHPLFDDASVPKILARAHEKNISTHLIGGMSMVDVACSALGIDPLARGLQIADANVLAQQHFPHLDPDQPAMISRMHNHTIARACKSILLIVYPRDHLVTRMSALGTAGQKIATMPLAELDHADNFDFGTMLYVPPLSRPSSLNALGEVVGRLRAPDGCPWDRAQTHRSLRKDFLEECYEVLETLDQEDLPHLREELGDLLLHILLQAQIASESGEFLLTDVVADIAAKLVRRHPHVFADVKVNGIDEIVGNWERIKQSENGGKKTKPSVPRAMPALARAQKIAKRGKVRTKLKEIAASVEKMARTRNREKALGEVLFAVAAYASEKQIDAESALRSVAAQHIG